MSCAVNACLPESFTCWSANVIASKSLYALLVPMLVGKCHYQQLSAYYVSFLYWLANVMIGQCLIGKYDNRQLSVPANDTIGEDQDREMSDR